MTAGPILCIRQFAISENLASKRCSTRKCRPSVAWYSFKVMTDDAEQGEYLTAAEIFQELKSHIGSSLKLNSLIAFGRKLSQMPTIHRKRFNDGMRYLVVRKS